VDDIRFGVEFETIISLDEGVAWFTGVTELRANDWTLQKLRKILRNGPRKQYGSEKVIMIENISTIVTRGGSREVSCSRKGSV
jgi:hypothetical protein